MKHLGYIFTSLICLFQLAHALPETLWTTRYGMSGSTVGNAVRQTTDGGYIITGQAQIYGASIDVWLIKTNEIGDTLWTRTYGGSGHDKGYSVLQTTDGGYIIVGETKSIGAGESDIWIIRTDHIGDTLWTRTYGGLSFDEGWCVDQLSDGSFIVIGHTNSTGVDIYDYDAWLIKIDSSGDTLWTQTYGGSGFDQGFYGQQTTDGGYIFTGITQLGPGGIWLVKTDLNGDTLWTRTYFSGYGRFVQQTTDGGYVIAGYTASVGAGHYDYCLIKTDSNGDTLWTQTFGGTGEDYCKSGQQTTDGGYILAGQTSSFGAGYTDIYVVKTNASGEILWQQTYGVDDFEYGMGVRQTSDGGYVVVGQRNDISFGDVWLIRLSPDDTLDLVAYYPFNGNANDESGNGNDGIVYGAALTEDRLGNASSAYRFDGEVDDYIIVNPVGNFPSTEITASFWMTSSDELNEGTPLSYTTASVDNLFLIITYQDFAVWVNGVMRITGVSANDGKWHSIAATWRSFDGEVNVYKDGLLSFSGTLSTGAAMENGGSLVFGQDQDSIGGGFQTYQAFSGIIDDIRIYNRALTVGEIESLYHEGGWDLVGEPMITSILDVPEDQGRQVFVNWRASEWDSSVSLITQYGIWEQDLEGKWVSLGNTPALQDTAYTYLASTFRDSTDQGIYWSTLKVTAHTRDPETYFTSAVDSGYSIDNIAPGVPEDLLASSMGDDVQLSWSASVDEDFGYFRIYRSEVAGFDPSAEDPITEIVEPTYTDSNLTTGLTFYYRVSAIDANGNESGYSDEVSAPILSIEENEGLPAEYALHPAYPNPFNPASTIRYDLPQASEVSLIVYDILGREVKRLVDGYIEPGYHQTMWAGKDQFGRSVPSGIYIARLVTPEYSKSIKMLLLK
jgi:hypothetical protein